MSDIVPGLGEPSMHALKHIVDATQHGPLADLFAGFGEEAAQRASGILMMAILNGDNPIWNEGGPGIADLLAPALNVPLWRAQTIARTEMLNAYRDANLATFAENSDVIGQWQWSADKSSRTCAACLAMDGTLHDLDEEMDSHVNCRCTPIPVTKSWNDILSDAGIDTSGLDLPAEPDFGQSGADWFAEQSPSVQQQILGKQAYQLYQSGTPLSDFVGVKHDAQYGNSVYVKSVKELQGG